ncbi:MAG: rubrerythrin family protein, partial [Syntrophobacteraceae bacterium]
FRAAAISEEIHLNNHAAVIQAMGGTPRASIELPKIGTTRKNLTDAQKGESYERQTMYPQFIVQAEKEKNANAVRTFTYAQNAEAQHAKLYGQALDNMKEWKTGKAEFSVCPTCGYTVESKPAFALCPVCATPGRLYKSVT